MEDRRLLGGAEGAGIWPECGFGQPFAAGAAAGTGPTFDGRLP